MKSSGSESCSLVLRTSWAVPPWTGTVPLCLLLSPCSCHWCGGRILQSQLETAQQRQPPLLPKRKHTLSCEAPGALRGFPLGLWCPQHRRVRGGVFL